MTVSTDISINPTTHDLALKILENSSIVYEKSIEPGYVIARTGVLCKIPYKDTPVFIGGFSCKSNESKAGEIARYESAERMLSTYYIAKISNPNLDFYCRCASSNDILSKVEPEKVILGPTLLKSSPHKDAVGLSFHENIEKAKLHGIYEIVERSLLGKIWYESHKLIQIKSEKSLSGMFTIEYYTVALDSLVPFVMAVAITSDGSCLTVGASFSGSWEFSMEKAKSETIMLINDVQKKASLDKIANLETKDRMKTQGDSNVSKSRYQYIKSICIKFEPQKDKYFSSIDLLEKLDLCLDDFQYCILYESDIGVVVRSYSDKIKILHHYRNIYKNTESYKLDPIV